MCGHCYNVSTCNPKTGLCSSGCKDSWKGDNCRQAIIYMGLTHSITTTNVSAYVVTISWRKWMPKIDLGEGRVKDYIIDYKESSAVAWKENTSLVEESSAEILSSNISNLHPNTNYMIRIRILDTEGNIHRSHGEPLRVKTVKSECPINYYGIQCNHRCGHCRENGTCDAAFGICNMGCNLGWKEPFCRLQRPAIKIVPSKLDLSSNNCTIAWAKWGQSGNVMGSTKIQAYFVEYKEKTAFHWTNISVPHEPGRTIYTLSLQDLTPSTTYEVHIRIIDVDGILNPDASPIYRFTTLCGIPSSAPYDVKVTVFYNSILIAWKVHNQKPNECLPRIYILRFYTQTNEVEYLRTNITFIQIQRNATDETKTKVNVCISSLSGNSTWSDSVDIMYGDKYKSRKMYTAIACSLLGIVVVCSIIFIIRRSQFMKNWSGHQIASKPFNEILHYFRKHVDNDFYRTQREMNASETDIKNILPASITKDRYETIENSSPISFQSLDTVMLGNYCNNPDINGRWKETTNQEIKNQINCITTVSSTINN